MYISTNLLSVNHYRNRWEEYPEKPVEGDGERVDSLHLLDDDITQAEYTG